MGKYRKKPIVIEAVQWTGEKGNLLKVTQFVASGSRPVEKKGSCLLIETLEGIMIADKEDWIIRGISGEHYPCKPDIFNKTYELVEE